MSQRTLVIVLFVLATLSIAAHFSTSAPDDFVTTQDAKTPQNATQLGGLSHRIAVVPVQGQEVDIWPEHPAEPYPNAGPWLYERPVSLSLAGPVGKRVPFYGKDRTIRFIVHLGRLDQRAEQLAGAQIARYYRLLPETALSDISLLTSQAVSAA